MQHLIRIEDYTKDDILEIFKIADEVKEGKYENFLKGKTAVLFFPNSSIRTRVAFEKGIALLGGHCVMFTPEALDKREKLEDVVKYLNNWADVLIVRHRNIEIMDELVKYANFTLINALTNVNHPCEMISDLYALSKIRNNFCMDKYLFVGAKGNIGGAWKEAAQVMGLDMVQCCPKGFEITGVPVVHDLKEAIADRDIICTDSLNHEELRAFKNHQITSEIMRMANGGALLNPCPPFFRGEEVSEDVINSEYFVGYDFKSHLLEVHQAIIIFNILHS